jgi:hypothetical protein
VTATIQDCSRHVILIGHSYTAYPLRIGARPGTPIKTLITLFPFLKKQRASLAQKKTLCESFFSFFTVQVLLFRAEIVALIHLFTLFVYMPDRSHIVTFPLLGPLV